jgi:hypothetical protein
MGPSLRDTPSWLCCRVLARGANLCKCVHVYGLTLVHLDNDLLRLVLMYKHHNDNCFDMLILICMSRFISRAHLHPMGPEQAGGGGGVERAGRGDRSSGSSAGPIGRTGRSGQLLEWAVHSGRHGACPPLKTGRICSQGLNEGKAQRPLDKNYQKNKSPLGRGGDVV